MRRETTTPPFSSESPALEFHTPHIESRRTDEEGKHLKQHQRVHE